MNFFVYFSWCKYFVSLEEEEVSHVIHKDFLPEGTGFTSLVAPTA